LLSITGDYSKAEISSVINSILSAYGIDILLPLLKVAVSRLVKKIIRQSHENLGMSNGLMAVLSSEYMILEP
jgi:prolyl-tRNA synthetase